VWKEERVVERREGKLHIEVKLTFACFQCSSLSVSSLTALYRCAITV
jgi:hypothetical protein